MPIKGVNERYRWKEKNQWLISVWETTPEQNLKGLDTWLKLISEWDTWKEIALINVSSFVLKEHINEHYLHNNSRNDYRMIFDNRGINYYIDYRYKSQNHHFHSAMEDGLAVSLTSFMYWLDRWNSNIVASTFSPLVFEDHIITYLI
jgi:hypothetical protein